MRNLLFVLTLLFSTSLLAADCSATECGCMLVVYHDPAAPAGSDIVTDKFNWQKAPGQLNRRLGKWEALRVLYSYQDNGVQACCSQVDNDQAQEPWLGFTVSHFAPGNGDRRGITFFLYAQTPEYAEWTVVTDGNISNSVEIPLNTVIDNSLIANLLNTADSRLIPITADQDLIDRARLDSSAHRADLLAGC